MGNNFFVKSLIALFLLAFVPALTNCSGTLATFGDDRSREQTLTDTEIILNINKRLLSGKNRPLFFSIKVDVFAGRVMLTGTVENEIKKQNAGSLVRGLIGVQKLYNDIQVTQSPRNTSNDIWIDAKIRAQLLATKNIKSLNYRWRVVNDTVYILGYARFPSEKAEIVRIIRQTSRVRGIVDRVKTN
ncbi:MAG: hypothetical protein CMM44_00450 [Rhodospirillaceae bacterium]|nr:hypothetical protein [Rhodospirillaceae bacterium]|tara:strand:+ start:19805 stop:20365 length:561 start_codon:yes stop_codon:yes gene_type:complete